MLAGRIGAHGQSCTDTGDALNVVPLLVGLHEQTSPGRSLPPAHILVMGPLELLRARGCKMVGVPGNAPGPGTHLVRFRL